MQDLEWLLALEKIIEQRKTESPDGSYTASLFAKGLTRMSQKVGEEGVETALAAAVNDPSFLDEASDLLFHLLVLLNAKGLRLKDVAQRLQTRHKK